LVAFHEEFEEKSGKEKRIFIAPATQRAKIDKNIQNNC
jgi:hypothetical protein